MITVFEYENMGRMWDMLCYRMMDSQLTTRVETRNGWATRHNGGVMITIRHPRERLLFDPERNCNHVFHLMESVWMLAGRRDVAFVKQFNSNIASYSDDDENFHAAYGYRWRNHFGIDQIVSAIRMLQADENDRRVVISMWDANVDGNGREGLDFPCNLMILPNIEYKENPRTHMNEKRLNFTIINRSNDLVWGLCGANAVHMSMLQEFMAGALGVKVGAWHHFSNNLHVYDKHLELIRGVYKGVRESTRPWMNYAGRAMDYHRKEDPLFVGPDNWEDFLVECEELCNGKQQGFRNAFLEETVEPVWASWREWKDGNYAEAIEIAESIDAFDWRKAVVEWYTRALFKKGEK